MSCPCAKCWNVNANNNYDIFFTLNGNMQGLLGVAPLSVTQIFSAACSSSPKKKKFKIFKKLIFEEKKHLLAKVFLFFL